VTSKPGQPFSLGMSLGDTRVLPRWGPAYRQHDLDLGSRSERAKARPEAAAGVSGVARETPERQKPRGAEYRRGRAGGLARSSCCDTRSHVVSELVEEVRRMSKT
jgi:hypothetical protein